jgi:membrane-bound lytic murein transglycosylase B
LVLEESVNSNIMTKRIQIIILFLAVMLSFAARAQSGPFAVWLQGVAQEAMESGVSPATAQQALSNLFPDESVIELDQKQPESTITFETYLHNSLTPTRLEKGRELTVRHKSLLKKIHARYGVPSSVIVALWGIESSFGRNTGDYGVIESLATLAYEGRRAAFFRKELIEALRVLDEEKMDSSLLRGSWAGAMGQCQFMPSTFRRHAVDFDGDGRRDIWSDESDVLASIANYLASEGWQRNQTWGREVTLTRAVSSEYIGLEQKQRLAAWGRLGVRAVNRKPLPAGALRASLIQPDGAGGRSFLVYDNFRALMRWNRSTFFAASVGLLADKIAVH